MLLVDYLDLALLYEIQKQLFLLPSLLLQIIRVWFCVGTLNWWREHRHELLHGRLHRIIARKVPRHRNVVRIGIENWRHWRWHGRHMLRPVFKSLDLSFEAFNFFQYLEVLIMFLLDLLRTNLRQQLLNGLVLLFQLSLKIIKFVVIIILGYIGFGLYIYVSFNRRGQGVH